MRALGSMSGVPRWLATLGFGLLVGSLGACTVDVQLGLECVDDSGAKRGAGEAFDLGCQACVCNGDGTLSCDRSSCECERNGVVYESGATFAENDCSECSCVDGAIVCTQVACACPPEPPPCDRPNLPSCRREARCNEEAGVWECSLLCDCDDLPEPACPAPPSGCFDSGPICDGTAWYCGEIICDDPCSAPPPKCDPPRDPACWTEPMCTPDSGFGWECLTYCGPVNQTCGGTEFDCPPSKDPSCTPFEICNADGTWSCTDDCLPLCSSPPPSCDMEPDPGPDPEPGMLCSLYPVCNPSAEWECVEYCQ